MIATLHLEEEWENHPTHKGAPEWSMDHEKTKSETRTGHEPSRRWQCGHHIHRLLSRQSMIMVGEFTPHWEQTVSGRCGIWDNFIDRPPTQTQPLWIPLIAQLLRRPFHPAISGLLKIGDVLNVDNTKGSDHREDEGNQEVEPKNWFPDCSGARQNPRDNREREMMPRNRKTWRTVMADFGQTDFGQI